MPSGSYFGHVVPPPRSSMEAYLLLEVAQSEKVISRMRKDLACKIVHCNTITLQLNQQVIGIRERLYSCTAPLVSCMERTESVDPTRGLTQGCVDDLAGIQVVALT